MLKIFDELSVFFEDCYQRVNVREYAKISGVSPPTASSLLNRYYKEGLLKKEVFKNYLFFYANKDNKVFVGLSKIYWDYNLKNLVEKMSEMMICESIILFGSLSKAETKIDSDVDIVIFTKSKKSVDLSLIEKKLKRKIEVMIFSSFKEIPSKELANNIVNGYLLYGKKMIF